MIIINTDYARENPKIVEGFMRATIRGMEFYLENKQESIDIVNKYATPEVAAATERASFLYDVTATQMPRADGCLAYIPPGAVGPDHLAADRSGTARRSRDARSSHYTALVRQLVYRGRVRHRELRAVRLLMRARALDHLRNPQVVRAATASWRRSA